MAGLPGVGKSTTAREVAKELQKQGYVPILVKPARDKIQKEFFEDFLGNKIPYIELPVRLNSEELKEVIELTTLLARRFEKGAGFLRKWWFKMRTSSKGQRYLESAFDAADFAGAFKKLVDAIKGYVNVDMLSNSISTLLADGNIRRTFISAALLGQPWLQGLLLALSAVSAIGTMGKMIKKYRHRPETPKKLVLIVDGISKYGFGGDPVHESVAKNALTVLLSEIGNAKVKTLQVARIELQDWFQKYRKDRVDWLGDLTNVESSEQIVELLAPEFEVFVEIMSANMESLDDEAARALYMTSGSLPGLALLAKDLRREKLDELLKQMAGDGRTEAKWPSFDRISGLEQELEREWDEKKAEKIEELKGFALRNVYRAARMIYGDLKERRKGGFSYVALLVQPFGVTEEELKELCQETQEYRRSTGIGCAWNLGAILGEESIIEVGHEREDDREHRIYRFSDLWVHLLPLVAEITKWDKNVAYDIAVSRKTLLHIMGKEVQKRGGQTTRMALSAMEHALKLSKISKSICEDLEISIDWLAKQAQMWGRALLQVAPTAGLRYSTIPTTLFEKSDKNKDILLSAAALASLLVNIASAASKSPSTLEPWLDVSENLLKPSCDDPAVVSWRVCCYTNMAGAMAKTGRIQDVLRCKKKAEILLEKIRTQKQKNLYLLTKAYSHVTLAIAFELFHGFLDESMKLSETALREIDDIEGKIGTFVEDEMVQRHLSVLGGDTKKMLEFNLAHLRNHASYHFALVLTKQGDTLKAGKMFKECWRTFGKLGDIRNELGSWRWYVKNAVAEDGIKVRVEDLEGVEMEAPKHFSLMRKASSEQYSVMKPEDYDFYICADALGQLLTTGKYPDSYSKDDFQLKGDCYSLFLGLAYIIEEARGLPHRHTKRETLEMLHELRSRDSNRNGLIASDTGHLAYILALIVEEKTQYAIKLAEEATERYYPPFSIRLFAGIAEESKAKRLDETILDKLVRAFFYLT